MTRGELLELVMNADVKIDDLLMVVSDVMGRAGNGEEIPLALLAAVGNACLEAGKAYKILSKEIKKEKLYD